MEDQETTLEILIDDTRIMIRNSLNRLEIRDVIANVGYNETALRAAESLHARSDGKYLEYRHKHGEQIEATRKFQEKFKEELGFYLDYRKLAKRALRGKKYEGLREKLGIDNYPRRTISGFTEDALRFYHGAINNTTVIEKVGTFSMTVEKLQERLTGINAMKVLDEEQEAMMGVVHIIREERDKLCDELAIWKSDFITAARIAFKDMSEYLDILRIKPISPRTAKKPAPPVPGETPTGQTGQTGQTAQKALADQATAEEKMKQE